MPPFLFVTGYGRSGTSLLQAMLDGHPDVVVTLESRFPLRLVESRSRYERPSGLDRDRLVRDVLGEEGLAWWELDDPESFVRGRLSEASPRTVPEAVEVLYSGLARLRGARLYGDKTPRYVRRLDALDDAYPRARYVHVIRDGRDAALSYLDQSFGPDSLETSALLWQRTIRSARRTGRRLGPDKYFEVRYERLVDDPEAILTDLCAFLGLSFSPMMLDYSRKARAQLAGATTPGHHQNLTRPPTRDLRDWRSSMSTAQRRRFERIAGDLLADLDYEVVERNRSSAMIAPALRLGWRRLRG